MEKEAGMKEKKKKAIQWERITSEEMVCIEAGKAPARYQTSGEPTSRRMCPCLVKIPTPTPFESIICGCFA